MSQAQCLPLHAQKAVIGRLLGFEVLAPHLVGFRVLGFEDASARLAERLHWLTNEALDDPDSDESLDSFLARLVGKLRAEAAEFRPAAAADAAGSVLDELEERVKTFCASPYDPVEKLFKAVAQTATDFYRASGEFIPSLLWQNISCKVSFLRGKAGFSFAPDIHLQIGTRFGPGAQPSAEIFFKIIPRWLDAISIATMPRALLHEYIVHIPQGPFSDVRIHPDANDAFAEGWMDYVAHHVHRSVLERRGPYQALAEVMFPTWADIYEDAASHFFRMRRLWQDRDGAAAARADGAAAASQFHDLLRRLPESMDDPDAYLYRLSFGLNASTLGTATRQRLVYKIRRSLLLASEADQLVPVIRRWAGGQIALEDLAPRLLPRIHASTDV